MVGAVSARLAVLIDAENAPLWAVEPLLTDIARYGKAQVKRAYGDWSALTSWKKTLLELSIRPVQVFAAVKGKNAADLALTIDAMDLLHSGTAGNGNPPSLCAECGFAPGWVGVVSDLGHDDHAAGRSGVAAA